MNIIHFYYIIKYDKILVENKKEWKWGIVMFNYDFATSSIVDIVNNVIIFAVSKRASDIHIDSREKDAKIRIRIDGILSDYTNVPKEYQRNFVTRVKLMSGMNITETRLPQDGAIKGRINGVDLDMRVSALPTVFGEKIVIRILDFTKSTTGLDSLGFSEKNFAKLLKMISVPNGIVLVTGATGTGKSTTVYTILQHLNVEGTNIITVEDPVEMNIAGINQVQVNSEIGLTFGRVLRSVLRQDPNIILIGEIRDSETAQIAVRASITGHLVLSTVHTNDSLSTIERLIDMDVERYLLSTALTGIISQRLARTICPNCRIKRPTNNYEKEVFKHVLNIDIEEIYDANPDNRECNECNGGYKGRIAIQEVLVINDKIRETINDPEVKKEELRKLVYRSDVTTLLQDGLEKVLKGLTTFSEIYRIIEIDNALDSKYGEEIHKEDNVENNIQSEDSNIIEHDNTQYDTNDINNDQSNNEDLDLNLNYEFTPPIPDTSVEEL